MSEIETEVALESEAVESEEVSEFADAGAIVEEIVASESTEDPGEPVVEDPTGEEFTPNEDQVAMAKLLSMSDEEIAAMTPDQAFAIDKVARLDSRRQQRRGKEAIAAKKPAETPKTTTGAESSTDGDDEFTEEDWFTDTGRKKINAALKGMKAQNQAKNNTEQNRLKAESDKVFDSLDSEIFGDFSPGESALIESGSAAEAKRAQVVRMATTIQATANGMGQELSMEQAMKNALSVIAPTETANAAQKEADAGRKKRGKQRMGTPSNVKGKHKIREATPEAQAVADTLEDMRS